MHRPPFPDRLIQDDALGHRRRPNRLLADDSGEFVDASLRLSRHRRHAVEDHTAQLEIGIGGVPDLVDDVGDAADTAKPKCRRLDHDQRVLRRSEG